jgi:hypothetical protein
MRALGFMTRLSSFLVTSRTRHPFSSIFLGIGGAWGLLLSTCRGGLVLSLFRWVHPPLLPKINEEFSKNSVGILGFILVALNAEF